MPDTPEIDGGQRIGRNQPLTIRHQRRIARGKLRVRSPPRAKDIGPEPRQLRLRLAPEEGHGVRQIAVEDRVMPHHRLQPRHGKERRPPHRQPPQAPPLGHQAQPRARLAQDRHPLHRHARRPRQRGQRRRPLGQPMQDPQLHQRQQRLRLHEALHDVEQRRPFGPRHMLQPRHPRAEGMKPRRQAQPNRPGLPRPRLAGQRPGRRVAHPRTGCRATGVIRSA